MEIGITKNDDIVVSNVNKFIDQELKLIDQYESAYDKRIRFHIFREAFNKVIFLI